MNPPRGTHGGAYCSAGAGASSQSQSAAKLEIELIQACMTLKPLLWVEVIAHAVLKKL
jgi:hypothetical protein